MPLATANDIIQLVLKSSGVIGEGQTASATDSNDALNHLNMMIAQWNNKRWLIYNLIELQCTATGNMTYTIGPGQQFDTGINQRPDQIEYGFARLLPLQVVNVDWQLQIIPSRENYSEIVTKNLGTVPSSIYYDSDWPSGLLYVWPVPPVNQYQIHINIKNSLQSFPNLTTQFNMPPEYLAAIFWNLVCWLKPNYQLPVDPVAVAYARESLRVLRGSNSQVPNLRMPSQLFSYPGRYQNFGVWLSGIF